MTLLHAECCIELFVLAIAVVATAVGVELSVRAVVPTVCSLLLLVRLDFFPDQYKTTGGDL